jgi:hypothetical protein
LPQPTLIGRLSGLFNGVPDAFHVTDFFPVAGAPCGRSNTQWIKASGHTRQAYLIPLAGKPLIPMALHSAAVTTYRVRGAEWIKPSLDKNIVLQIDSFDLLLRVD